MGKHNEGQGRKGMTHWPVAGKSHKVIGHDKAGTSKSGSAAVVRSGGRKHGRKDGK